MWSEKYSNQNIFDAILSPYIHYVFDNTNNFFNKTKLFNYNMQIEILPKYILQ
jgi:hypothetical protein